MKIRINGSDVELEPLPLETLAATLRGRLHLTGTKLACGRGECGACTVLLNGKPVYSCLVLTRACQGAEVVTIEGIASAGELHPVQRAFIEHDAVQCGFCTPGQVMAAVALLRERPDPSEAAIRAAMSGNLCRCGTYPRIVAAIRSLARGDNSS
ncbi:MAG TPA: (2Fe-2S)-binding protein [Gemmatimonadaceae bacterium]|nr:(2Fe-2S)-binding protein [Gemmatimonadaceae bacterium]